MKSYQSHLFQYIQNSKKPISINTSRNASINVSHIKSNSIINPLTSRNQVSINAPIKLINGYNTTTQKVSNPPTHNSSTKVTTKLNATLNLNKKDSNKNSSILSSTLTRNTLQAASHFNATVSTKHPFPQILHKASIKIIKKQNPKQVEQQLRDAIKMQFTNISDLKPKAQSKPSIILLKKNTSYQNPQSPSVSSTNVANPSAQVNNLVAPVPNKIKSISFNSSTDKIALELMNMPKVMPKNTALDPRGSVSPRTTIESKETAASRKSSHHDSKKSTGEIKIQLKLDYDSPKSSNLMTIETAIDRFADELADYEYEEMQQYKDIYFVGKLCSKLQKLDKHSKNFGWDDKKGFYLLKTQDHLKYRYEVLSVIGNGSFGVVYKCLDWKTKEEYAVKILRNKEKFHKQGRIEIDILKVLNATSKKEAQFVVEMKDSFVFRNHICIVFEMLSIDLYQLIKVSKFSVFI